MAASSRATARKRSGDMSSGGVAWALSGVRPRMV